MTADRPNRPLRLAWLSCAVWLVLSFAAARCVAQTPPVVRVALPPSPSATMENTARLLARHVALRCQAKIIVQRDGQQSAHGEDECRIELSIAPAGGAEGFRIEDLPKCDARQPGRGVRIVGHDERGLLYGAGKFLRTSRYDGGRFAPSAWRGASVPQKPARGIYLATHFHNFYHDAPLDEVVRYVEDLGLWGFNIVVVWYDMHHFAGFDSPEAVEFRKRLAAIGAAARRLGLDVGLVHVANEGYANSPASLRGDVRGMRGAIFPSDICTSKPEGRRYVLDNFARLYDWAGVLEPRWAILWPYDSGGCGCAECRPWGSRGFPKAAKDLSTLIRAKRPGTKIVLSTWLCEEGELSGLDRILAADSSWVDYVLAEGTPRPTPGGLPLVGFPEISMHGMWPWGGFGATPLPRHFQKQWDAVRSQSRGGFPYSEGIYEDVNKAVFGQFYWANTPAETTLREYIAYEYSPEVVDDVLTVIATLERNHHMRWWPGMLEGVALDQDWFPSRGTPPQADPGAEEAYATVRRVDAKLPAWARSSWRWRQLYLRTLLDAELKHNGGAPNDACWKAFSELTRMYHAENANPTVRPPLGKRPLTP